MQPKFRVLAAESLKGRHTGDNMGAVLSQVLNDYKIGAEKVHLILRDDEAAMQRATRVAGFDSLQCTAHKLNLCVWDALKILPIGELLEKVKKSIRKIRKSRVLRDEFVLLQDENSLPKRNLIKGINVRWNSVYLMLERFYENEEALVNMPGKDKSFPVFSPTEWKCMKNICAILRPIHRATLKVQSRHASISCIIPLIKAIEFELRSLNTEFLVVRDKLCESLSERFDGWQFDKRMLVATLLDPAYKGAFFKGSLIFERAKDMLLFEVEMIAVQSSEVDETNLFTNRVEEEDGDPFAHFYHDSDDLAAVIPSTVSTPSLANAKAMAAGQVADYLNSPLYDGESYNFWKNTIYIAKYPLLMPLVKKYHSAPSTSAESERLFSGAKLIVTDLRKNLNVETLQELLFLHQNLLINGFV